MMQRKMVQPKKSFLLSISLAVALGGSLIADRGHAADGTWTSGGTNRNWSATAGWLDGIIADGTDAVADFSTVAVTANNRTVTIDGAVASRTVGTLLLSDTDAATSNNNWVIASSGNGTLTLATSVGIPTITVGIGLTGVPSIVNSTTITAPIAGTQGLIKNGPGVIRLQGANTFTGDISVVEGTLRLGGTTNAAALGSSSNAVTVSDGAQMYINTVATFSNSISINGLGVLESDGLTRLGAIRFDQNGAALSGTITLTGDSGISARGASAAGATVSGQITGNHAIRFNHTSTTTSAGNGILLLSNTTNNWTGTTTISDGTLKLGASGVIPNGTGTGDVVMDNVFIIAGMADTVLDLNGFNETINGLSHSVGSDLAKIMITNGVAGTATLTVGDNNATGAFGGILQDGTGKLALTKIGTGEQTLSGANTYTGDTIIEAGTLTLTLNGMLADTSNVHLNGGTLNLTFIGTDDIAGLFLNGAPLAVGTWGAPGSGAANSTPFITGSGILNVVPEPGTWAMLALGAGVVGLLHMRRRRRQA